MNKLSSFFIILMSFGFALADSNLVNDIANLTEEIHEASKNSNLSQSTLEETRSSLRELLYFIQEDGQGGSVGPQGCFHFAFERYNTSYSSANASDKAALACKMIEDMDVAKFLFEKHNLSVSAATAMDLTAKGSLRTKKKLDMIKFAFEKYFPYMGSSGAATKASLGVMKVPRGSLKCLTDLYGNFNITNSSSEAMTRALKGCSK